MHPSKRTPTAQVKDPKWTGADGEMAIVVSRGEPRRTDVQMQRAVYGQISRYLAGHTELDVSDFAISMTSQLIAQDYIEPEGSQGVMLNREHLIGYVALAQRKLNQLGGAR